MEWIIMTIYLRKHLRIWKMTELQIINLLDLAIQLAGDGGPNPFTDEEYREMYRYLENLKKQCKD